MIRRATVWAVALAVAALLTVFAYHGYPTPSTDAPSFLVSAINHSLGRGLVNPFYPQIAFGDPTGLHRHVYYPPAFPLLVSALMPSPTPRGAFLAVAALRVASLLLAAWLLGRLARLAVGAPPRDLTLPVALSLCGLATNWLPTVGRPEALATLLVLLAALAAMALEGGARVGAFGVLLGAMAATQPMGAVELGLLMALFLAAVRKGMTAVVETAATAALGLVAFALLLSLTPHGLTETLAGMARSYPHTPWTAPPGDDWWRPWITSRRSTFYGPLLLAALACGVALLREHWTRLGARPLFLAAALLLGACFYHGSFTHRSLRNYNALLMAPLFFGVIVAWAARSPSGRAGAAWARTAATACVAATSIGFVAHAAAFPWFVRHGRTLDQARAEWSALPLPPGGVAMLGNLWALTEDYDRLEMTPVTAVWGGAVSRPVLLIGPRDGEARPRTVPGFVLARDFFNPALAEGGWPRAFVREDYSFAVYLRAR